MEQEKRSESKPTTDLQPPLISDFWAWLAFHFTRDWRMIIKYPIALFAVCVFIVVVAWFLTWQVVVPEKEQQLQTKQATIDAKQSQIDFLSQKLDALQKDNDSLQSENQELHSEVEKGEPSLLESALQKMMTNNPIVPPKIVQWRPPELTKGTKFISIQVGNSGNPAIIPIVTNQDYQIPFYQLSGHVAITAHVMDGRIYLNLNVPTGELPIEVKNGKSTPLPEGWDWNGDSNALEIVDKRGEAVIQEQYLPSSVIEIQGEVQVGDQIFLTPDVNSAFSEGPFAPSMFHPENDNLVTIFQYPSSDHLGERLP